MLRAVTIAIALTLAAGVGANATQRRPAYELMRDLQDFQDRSAFGKEQVADQIANAAIRFAETVNSEQIDWKDERDRSAVAYFLLTGGDAQGVRKAVVAATKDRAEAALLGKALEFSVADNRDAREGLEAVDPREAPAELAGALALAQARVLAKRDRARASEKLTAAQILSPGGLIEEAALRQQLFLLDSEADARRVARIVHRYLGRFANSYYAENFLQRLERLVEDMWTATDAAARREFMDAIESLPATARTRLAMRLARSSLLRGDQRGALTATEAVCKGQTEDAAVRWRCDLYREIASIYGRAETEGGADLAMSHWEGASDEDRLLRACAWVVSAYVYSSQSPKIEAVSGPKADDETQEVKKVRRRISEVDLILSSDR